MDSLEAHARLVQDLRQRIVFRSRPKGCRRFVPARGDHGALGIGRARTVLFNKADPGFVEQLGLPCFCVRHSGILTDGVRPQKPAGEGGWRPHAQRRPERSMIAPATLAKHWALKSPAQIGTMDMAERFKGAKEKTPASIERVMAVFGSAMCGQASKALPTK
ncbi:hypothetical protein AB8A20_15835 [Tardiphaga sp. 604_B6_N1_1]|uniref:hypothetical protein n=1 Tax=Tardiphaga sp. 604_B6_N1_1 TaxID=3240779 RepID=UPI003F226E5F